MPVGPFISETPLRFRGLPDSLAASHLEASECCLIHADNPLSASKGIFLNPNVKVGYNGSAYDAVHSPKSVLSPFQIYRAVWENRLRRWLFTTTWWTEFVVQKTIMKWTQETGGNEAGGFCTIDEMQVIYERGWKHV
jgi:hypothetical protein